MLIPAHGSTLEEVSNAFTEELPRTICNELRLDDSETEKFSYLLVWVTARYLELKRANPIRLQPNEQRDLLDQLKIALEHVKTTYEEILSDTSLELKFSRSLIGEWARQDPKQQNMLFSCVSEEGYSHSIFINFLGSLTKVAEDAKHIDIGKEKSDLGADFLAWWVAVIRQKWPKNAAKKFSIGDREARERYKSYAADMLFRLIQTVDDSITITNIESAIRKAIKNDGYNDPTKFLLRQQKNFAGKID